MHVYKAKEFDTEVEYELGIMRAKRCSFERTEEGKDWDVAYNSSSWNRCFRCQMGQGHFCEGGPLVAVSYLSRVVLVSCCMYILTPCSGDVGKTLSRGGGLPSARTAHVFMLMMHAMVESAQCLIPSSHIPTLCPADICRETT